MMHTTFLHGFGLHWLDISMWAAVRCLPLQDRFYRIEREQK